MKATRIVATLAILTVSFVAPTSLAAEFNGEGIIDACTGIATIDHRVNIIWPLPGADSGRADDADAGDKGIFVLLDQGLVDGLWRYAMSGETAGDCGAAITAEVCNNLTPEAREWLASHCPAE